MIAPHFDRWISWIPTENIPGLRKGWRASVVSAYAGLRRQCQRDGFMSALYCLRAAGMPGAHERDAGIADFQQALDGIIGDCAVIDSERKPSARRRGEGGAE